MIYGIFRLRGSRGSQTRPVCSKLLLGCASAFALMETGAAVD